MARPQKARCGACGCEKHTVSMDDATRPTVIELRCCDCSTTTVISILPTTMTTRPKGRSIGQIAVF